MVTFLYYVPCLFFEVVYGKLYLEVKKMKNNFHTHTNRCLHAYGTERDYALEAVRNGMSQLGFSDHGPFADHDYGYRMQYSELKDYISSIELLKTELEGRLRLYKGLEIEFHKKYIDYYSSLLEEHGLDYLALGEHIFYDRKGEEKNIFFASSTEDYLEYAENVCKGIETGLFAFVAHPDLMFLNSFEIDRNVQEACDMIIQCADENNTVLEFNANGFRRRKSIFPDGIRHPYPHPFFWKKAAEKNIRIIVGSDCHAPEQLCDTEFNFAFKEAERLGLALTESIFKESSK